MCFTFHENKKFHWYIYIHPTENETASSFHEDYIMVIVTISILHLKELPLLIHVESSNTIKTMDKKKMNSINYPVKKVSILNNNKNRFTKVKLN